MFEVEITAKLIANIFENFEYKIISQRALVRIRS